MTAELPPTLAANPNLSKWININSDGSIELRIGKVELGQGILTAITLIAANELGVDPGVITMTATNTSHSPNEGLTAGSKSIQDSGPSVSWVCAEVRRLFAQAAARLADLQALDLRPVNGEFRNLDGTYIASYAELAGLVDLNIKASATDLPNNETTQDSIDELRRIDLPDKIFGRPRFIHDLIFEGMLHARIARPPGPGAHLIAAPVEEVKAMPGVRTVVSTGDFLAVIATREGQAQQAADYLAQHSSWTESKALPDQDALVDWFHEQPVQTIQVRNDPMIGRPEPQLSATYTRPFLVHGSIGPSCAVATLQDEVLQIWTNSQGVFGLRSAIASALGIKVELVVVQHVEGPGSYGHNGADDAAFEAALLATAMPGNPIRVQWTRAEDLAWEPVSSAMVSHLAATINQEGRITEWSTELWSNGHAGRPGYNRELSLLSDAHRSGIGQLPPAVDPPAEASYGGARNLEPLYDFPSVNLLAHRLLTMPIRTSALRSLGAHHNIFAMESFLDELADQVNIDPLEFRLSHLVDERAKDVLKAAAAAAGWGEKLPDNQGRGIAFARYKNRGAYCAVVADVIAVDSIEVKKLTVAVDVGRIISADGVRNQIEGGAIQATSWTLREEVKFDRSKITSTDWETYPILRFREVPRVEVHLISRPDQPSLGSGEAAMGPVSAAIGNAIFSALGVRLRNLPFTQENIVKAIEAS
ncbi:MAG TPA: molybdopterin cofactor-binding domain-containing protein [Candidatus Nanopelagicaceae bacterium]|nr:molybdopterin cofactor-binding domain-containing protein [Candidatus Nanopelagicaceae bacterium]